MSERKRPRTIAPHLSKLVTLASNNGGIFTEEIEEIAILIAYDCALIAMEYRGVPCDTTAENIARHIRAWAGTTDEL